MANKRSLVYLDNVLQRALKDILIPTLGYRDTSKTFGKYTSLIDDLRTDVTALQIPPKGKVYIHDNLSQPINIAIPNNAYGTDLPAYENIVVDIDFTEDNTDDMSISIQINTQNGLSSAHCIACNKNAFETFKSVTIKELYSTRLQPERVYQLFIPEVNISTSSRYGRAVITLYSENRHVLVTKAWDNIKGNEDHVNTRDTVSVTLGSVPYFKPIESPESLVRSNTVRDIESISEGTYQYMEQVKNTVPTTLYTVREDELTNRAGQLVFKTVSQLQKDKDVLMSIFGEDWSELEIAFSDDIDDISGAFEGFTFTSIPKSIIGKNVKYADRLFMNSKVTRIPDQALLFQRMPKLETINSCFENTPLTGRMGLELIQSNERLIEMNRCFKNTKITDTYAFWDHTSIYTPDRDVNDSTLNPDPEPITIHLEGNGAFAGVMTLPNTLPMPDNWDEDTNNRTYKTVQEFFAKRRSLLSQTNNDLSLYSITIEEPNADLARLFADTDITKAPKAIISTTAKSISQLFENCSKMVEIYSTTLAQLVNVVRADRLVHNCTGLRSIPVNIVEPLKNIDDYELAFAGLTNITGPTPTSNGKKLYQLAGTTGYPADIQGTRCFEGSTFSDIASVPKAWGGNA